MTIPDHVEGHHPEGIHHPDDLSWSTRVTVEHRVILPECLFPVTRMNGRVRSRVGCNLGRSLSGHPKGHPIQLFFPLGCEHNLNEEEAIPERTPLTPLAIHTHHPRQVT